MTAMNAMPASSSFGLQGDLANAALSSLSWSPEEGEGRRLTIITVVALLLFVPLALVIPAMEVPEPSREKAETVPPQLAKLLVAPKVIEKPDPMPLEDIVPPEPKPEPKLEPVPVKPEPIPAPAVVKPVVQPVPVPQPTKAVNQSVEQAREKASRSGLLGMRDRLASMRQEEPQAAPVIQANTGNVAVTRSGTDVDAQPGEGALKNSGGVKDVQAPQVEVAVAGHDVRKLEATPQPAPAVAHAPAPKQKASAGERAMSNIRQVFDSGKTALYSLYQRELRQDPALAGKVLLELVIEPDGSVSACKVVSSELANPMLEQKIAMRVRLFNFGADNVEARKVRFPIDFLPG
ncbi:AgmX/PglI C-terminal domain-containing protein [Marinobacter salexigens]|uniref:AgmX/PglI C-terminal domain-containing protein n=1 Tax=Marinobacter salexigens TaxID=1925763 RepID=UPI001EFDFA47|nr:AgmX/PglI C-terminal domain-containing protein [Marinobacter salexigens]